MSPYAYAIAAAAIAGTGAAAWHWTPFIGPQAQMTAKDDQITALRASVKQNEADLATAKAEVKNRDDELRRNGETAAAEAERLALSTKLTCKGAFDAGYAARRCPAGGAPDNGVRDLRGLQAAGAFRASPGVPGKPEGRP